MGQKTNPTVLRLGLNKTWDTNFFEKKNKELPKIVNRDLEIRQFVKRFMESKGLIIKDYKVNYSEGVMSLFISYSLNNFKSVNSSKENKGLKLINKVKTKKYGFKLYANKSFLKFEKIRGVSLKNSLTEKSLRILNKNNLTLTHKIENLILRDLTNQVTEKGYYLKYNFIKQKLFKCLFKLSQNLQKKKIPQALTSKFNSSLSEKKRKLKQFYVLSTFYELKRHTQKQKVEFDIIEPKKLKKELNIINLKKNKTLPNIIKPETIHMSKDNIKKILKSESNLETYISKKTAKLTKNNKVNNFVNNRTLSEIVVNNDLQKLMKVLSLFTYNQFKIRSTFCCIDKTNLKSSKTKIGLFKKKVANLQKFKSASFFPEGLHIIFSVIQNRRNSSKLLAELISQHFKTLGKRKFFLAFLKKGLTQFIDSPFSLIKGVRIKIKGRLFNRPRAKSKTLTIGHLPIQTFNTKVNYSQSTAHNSYGSCGIRVWVVEK